MSGFKGHRPSGKTSWPVVLVAGAEKVGKSYLVAKFTGSDLLGETFWIEFGEHTAEEYGSVPGARYEIGDYDGTFNDMCRRVREAVDEPQRDGKPNCIVLDSVSVIWETLSTEAQQMANRRKKADLDAESKITSDIWNVVTERWKKLLRILKSHNGPVILCARLDVVAVMDANGQPTKEKTQKVKAQKSLPYDVDVIVQIPTYRRYQLTGVRSLRLQMPPGETFDMPPDFTLDALMRNLGLAELAAVPRTIVEPVASAEDALAGMNDGAGPDRPMQHQQPRADDEWTGPPNVANGKQIADILSGLETVRGITDGAAKQAAIEAMVGHPVLNVKNLTFGEAVQIIGALTMEYEATQAPPVSPAVGTPNNPGISEPQRKLIQAHFRDWSRDNRLAEIARILDNGPVASVSDLSLAEAKRVIDAIGAHAAELAGAST